MVYYSAGTATTEQDLIVAIDTFLTSTIGSWSRIGTITDTSSDKDYVYKVAGPGTPGQYRDIFVCWGGDSNTLYVYGYSAWYSAASYSDQLYSTTYAATGASAIKYWFFGDSTYLWVVIKNGDDNYYYSCFGGFIDSYYSYTYDPLPLAVVGQTSYATGLQEAGRTQMYSATVSGSNVNYLVDHAQTDFLAYGDPNVRDNSQAHYPLILYSTTAGSKEIRGEFPGAVKFSGDTLVSEDWVVVSGTDYKFFIRRYSTDDCEGYGPVHV